MSKNMTRKGIALAAGVALGLSGLTAAPANAALDGVSLAPLSGTSGGAILGSTFYLIAGANGADADGTNITFAIDYDHNDIGDLNGDVYVTNDDEITPAEAAAATTERALSEDADDAWGTDTDVDGTNQDVTSADTVALGTSSVDTTSGAADAVTNANPYAVLALHLEEAVDATTSIDVYAFEDANSNGRYDANLGEEKSTTFTITYLATDEVTATLTLTADAVANEVDAVIKLTNVNMASSGEGDSGELDTLVDAVVLNDGAEDLTIAEDKGTDIVDADLNATGTAYETTFDLDGAIDGGSVVLAYLYAGDNTTDKINTTRLALGASDVLAYGDVVVAGNDTDNSGTDIRDGDGSFTASLSVYGDLGAPVAGETVTFTFSDSALDGGSITVGGSTLEAGDDPITATAVSDSNGKATVTVTYADFSSTDGDEITVDASVLDNALAVPATVTALATASSWDIAILNSSTSDEWTVEYGDRTTVSFRVLDQYGQGPDVDTRMKVAVDGTDTSVSQWVYVANSGVASLSFTNEEDADDTLAITVDSDGAGNELDFKDADGDYGNDFTAATLVGQDEIDVVEEISSVASVSVDAGNSHDSDTALTLADETVSAAAGAYTAVPGVTVDLRAALTQDDQDDLATALAALGQANANAVEVDVLDSNNLGIAGVPVTFSAPGLTFFDGDNQRISDGSITVLSGTGGATRVYFYSTESGDHTVTVTAAGKSDTLDVAIDYASATYEYGFNVTSGAYADAGSTYIFTGYMVDRNGNGVGGVAVDDITWDGPGLVVGDIDTTSSATGKFSFAVLFGSNDLGKTATVTFEQADDGVDAAAAADGDAGTDDIDLEVEFIVTVGSAPVDQKVNAGSFKGYVAVYARGYEGSRLSAKVGKDWVVVPSIVNNQENGTLFRVVEFTGAGYDVAVRIYIDRVLVDTINLTTK